MMTLALIIWYARTNNLLDRCSWQLQMLR